MTEEIARQFLLCDEHPQDRLAWETLQRTLKRRGYAGPLATFVSQHLRSVDWKEEEQARIAKAVAAWKPLVSQGFVLFTQGQFHRYGRVLHIGRIHLRGEGGYCTREYPEGWQRSTLSGVCGASSGIYTLEGAWTQQRTPFRGHEHPPCQTCLQHLGGRRTWFWAREKRLSRQQLNRLWALRQT